MLGTSCGYLVGTTWEDAFWIASLEDEWPRRLGFHSLYSVRVAGYASRCYGVYMPNFWNHKMDRLATLGLRGLHRCRGLCELMRIKTRAFAL